MLHLGLTNAEFTDAICKALPSAKVLPQLEELDLKMGTMSDDGAAILREHAAAFKHLKHLNVDDNYLTDAGLKLLKGLCKEVETGEQREDEGPEERYASAIE